MTLTLAFCGSAGAQPGIAANRPGFDLGLRLGYAIPFGDIDADPGDGLASTFSGAIPFILEAGYRINPTVTVGALFQYAFAQINENTNTGCGGAVSCSGSVIRLGIQGIYHIPVPGTFAPWAGLGIGYEWIDLSSSAGGFNISFGAHGFEFLTLQGGADYRLAPNFSVGPFLSLSFARYGTVTAEQGGTRTSTDIANPALHEWLQLGVRGTFNL